MVINGKYVKCPMQKLHELPTSQGRYYGGTVPLTKMCSFSKLSTPFWKMLGASYIKLSRDLKNNIKIQLGQAALEL